MANSPQEKFDAAVKVIHSLPKDGPFQPSYDMMLNFYSYYKQATEGKCTKPKPWAWDIVNKKKWDAWTSLGDMPKEEAMTKYVEELKKTIKHFNELGLKMKENGDPRIVEAMPQNVEVEKFMEKLGSFYEIIDERSPIAEAKKMNGTIQPLQDDPLHVQDTNNLNHSQIIEHVLKKSEDINEILDQSEDALQNGIEEEDEDEEESTHELKETEILQTQEKTNGYDKDTNSVEERVRNGNFTQTDSHPDNSDEAVRKPDQKLDNGEHITTETDSDDEFCDTSDQPSQDEVDAVSESQSFVSNSTPLKAGKLGNHLHFGTRDQNLSSPMRGHVIGSSNQVLSDSLFVHAPGLDSLNVSYESSNGRLSHEKDSVQYDNKDQSVNSSNLDRFGKNVKYLGGGDMSPPGGSSDGQRRTLFRKSGGGSQMSSRQNQQGNGTGSQGHGSSGGGGRDNEEPAGSYQPGSVDAQMALALLRLQQDMSNVIDRLNSLEQKQKSKEKDDCKEKKSMISRWWPLSFNRQSVFVFLVWPLIVHWILLKLFHRRRKN